MRVLFDTFLNQTPEFDWFPVRMKRTNTPKTHVEKKMTVSLHFITYSTRNIKHNRENMCIQFKNQQTCTFDNHT